MQIVINISEKDYQTLRKKDKYDAMYLNYYEKLIVYGTPLPKGHGDLKDISKIDYQSGCFVSSKGEPIPIIHKIATIEMIRDWLPTIIEADGEVKE